MTRRGTRRRHYFTSLHDDEEAVAAGDQLGFPYPPLPEGGSRQVLGIMPSDPDVTPQIPEWLPPRHHRNWPTIWHSRPKQYRAPGSRELVPWDTTHDPMGDYQGYDEYYVQGCFGYDKDGEEIRYRPGLPGVHIWRGRGLILAPLVTRRRSPPSPPAPFNFYRSTATHCTDELKKPRSIPISIDYNINNDNTRSCKHETVDVTNVEFDLGPSTDVFEADRFQSDETTVVLRASTVESNGEAANLLNIPGEIRNLIYHYLYEEENDYEIMWCTRQRDLTHFKHKIPLDVKGYKCVWRRWAKNDPRLDIHFERSVQNVEATKSRRSLARQFYGCHRPKTLATELQAASPAAFLLTCRKLYEEAMPLFYQHHAFSFSSRSLLRVFMNNLSSSAMASIKKIYITHDPQGWPMRTKDAALVSKERSYWIQDLKKLAQHFTNLHELTMHLFIRDPHINDAERADWAMALRHGLAGLKRLPRFIHFDLVIRYGRDTSKVDWARWYDTATGLADAVRNERAQDLEDLVCAVKAEIFGAGNG